MQIYLDEGWWQHDAHAQKALELNLEGFDVFDDFTVLPEEQVGTIPIYTDFFKRVGFGYLMSCVILPKWDMFVAISVPRAEDKGRFTEAEKTLLQHIGRHVEQALRLSVRIVQLNATSSVLREALDAVDIGIFVIGADRRVLFANTVGSKLFDTLFDRTDGRILPKREEDRARFFGLLESLSEPVTERSDPRPCIVMGTDGGRVAIWALPVVDRDELHFEGKGVPQTLLFTTPIERDRMIDPVILREVFDLTLGEARIASLVGSGMAINDAADRLGVTEGTARNVLKQVFRKLGVNRQAQLVRQVANLWASAPNTK
ncbi:helix-turn-helix transcriptional regulator [Acuticoccus sp. M5D2P5]|uniref:helix-turn-helix transcriptional regulator n=1 Tax=Acuticoccus kalidii TaxID=2910977 RepID=UPI001F21663C|nr:helix-turn-helix transcriptional regulator [Acuticoccus kalidii]MCF3934810.1 helix-turn-helix transcriptional regulator [Acuticoccus kalidii]